MWRRKGLCFKEYKDQGEQKALTAIAQVSRGS